MNRNALKVSLLAALVSLAAVGCVESTDGASTSDRTLVQVDQTLSCAPIEYCPDAAEVAAECALEGRDAVTGPCGCLECAKLEGETCAGLWNLSGTCNRGLYCEIPPVEGDIVSLDQEGLCVADNCTDFLHQFCESDRDCPDSWQCGDFSTCNAGSCYCDSETGMVACTKDCVGGSLCEPAPTSCICTEQYEPVCGSDGVTYSNDCFATCAGADVWYPYGACGDDGAVCGTRGVAPCGAGLECVGASGADVPGSCQATLCEAVTNVTGNCGRNAVRIRGEVSSDVRSISIDVNGTVHEVNVTGGGRFQLRVPNDTNYYVASIPGCDAPLTSFACLR